MQNQDYYTTSTQYYAKDPISDDGYFLMPSVVSQVPHSYAKAPTTHYGHKNDSMYGSDKYEDRHNKSSYNMNHRHNEGHHGVPEVNKKAHFVERVNHVEIDKNGKREVHDEEIFVDVKPDGIIQKKRETFDKWETLKGY